MEGKMANKRFLPAKSDVIFRLFFADERNVEFLVGFLKSVLKLPDEDYTEIEIADPHLLREFVDDKYSVIDVKLRTKSRKTIHIEIQLSVTAALRERIVFYGSKLITEQVGDGDPYSTIGQVISIVIIDGSLIPNSQRYHHRFMLYEPDTGIQLSDLLEVNTLELKKLPDATDGTALYDWASFIAAESEEELAMAAERNPVVEKAVVKLLELSEDERARDLYERREKHRRDMATMIYCAKQEGLQEGRQEGLQEGQKEGRREGQREGRRVGRREGRRVGRREGKEKNMLDIARKMVSENFAVDVIIAITGLSREVVEGLTHAN